METQIQELKSKINGEVIVPSDPNYSDFSGTFHKPGNPAVIVRVGSNNDVASAIKFAKENKLELSVRSGGHGFGGLGTNEGGLIIDLSLLNKVVILDPARRIVKVGGGVRSGELMKELSKHGFALSTGDTNSVGIGGLTLGAGVGWMVRKYGFAIDNLVAAEIVTADGKSQRVSSDENPELFWGIRGGGGNFGVVTSFEFKTEAIKDVYAGTIIFKMEDVETVLTKWSEYLRIAPLELTSTLMLLPSFGPEIPPSLMCISCYAGDDETKAQEVFKPIREFATPVSQDIKKESYVEVLEDANPPEGMKVLGDNGFVKTINKEVIDTIVKNYGKDDSPMIQIRSLGGAVNNLKPEDTAFAHRGYDAFIIMAVFGPENIPHEELYARSVKAWEPLVPFTQGAYINFQTDTFEKSIEKAYPGKTYERLSKLKAQYDPENIFHRNANIKPE